MCVCVCVCVCVCGEGGLTISMHVCMCVYVCDGMTSCGVFLCPRWKGKKMFYLTTHSTHFILRLYGVRNMVEDNSDSERENTLPPHGLLFPINSKGSFICTIPQTG